MCGRYELNITPARMEKLFALRHAPDVLAGRYNIAPTQAVPVVRLDRERERRVSRVRWGLVPHWAKDRSIGNRTFNARAETVATAPAFRDAWRKHRCLVPASGFYEWQPSAGGKQPFHIGMADGQPFAFAGLWSRWHGDGAPAAPLDSCTIITTTPNALCASLHDRMPVIVAEHDYARWLDADAPDAQALLRPFPAQAMRAYPVSRRVNAVGNDDPSLLAPLPAPSALPAAEHALQQDLRDIVASVHGLVAGGDRNAVERVTSRYAGVCSRYHALGGTGAMATGALLGEAAAAIDALVEAPAQSVVLQRALRKQYDDLQR